MGTKNSDIKETKNNEGTNSNSPNDVTDEDEDSVDLLDIPVNVEIITDDEDALDDTLPSKRRKTTEPTSTSTGGFENLKKKVKEKSPRECFEEFFTDEVFDLIVKETKRYAVTVKNNRDFNVTVTDVKILLGFMIFAGYHRLPSERDYWSDDEDLGIPLVKAAMTRNAFAELKSCLHFQDNSKARESHGDKAFKIKPLMEILNKNFQKWDVFHESLSVGPMVIPSQGMSPMRQRTSSRVGYEFGVLCGDGYCYKFWIYSNQEDANAQLKSFKKGNTLKNTDSPNGVHPFELKTDLQHKKCSGGIKYYELLLRKYSIPIRGKKWYWCLFTRMIDMAVVNAHHVYKETQDPQKSIKDFRREIAVAYLKLGHCRSVTRSLTPNPSRTHVNEDVRFDGLNHIIGKRKKQRRCQFQNCKGRPKTYCVKCNITLCITCFPQFHFR